MDSATSRNNLFEWLNSLPDNYRDWVRPFLFSFKLAEEKRELINRLILLVVNTHVRRDTVRFFLKVFIVLIISKFEPTL